MLRELVDVRCRGCRRILGVAKRDTQVYCDDDCAQDYPATSTEARDALIEAVYLSKRGAYTHEMVGEMFGMTRQRVQQILVLRNIRKTPKKR
jgi:hypothetical protein